MYTGIPLGELATTCRVHWNTTRKKTYLKPSHTGMPLENLWLLQPTRENACQLRSSNVWILQHHLWMPWMWAPLWFLCVWGCCSSNKISLAQTTLTVPVVYIRVCMLRSDLPYWPRNQTLSVHWDTTGQTTLEPHWLMVSPSGLPVAIWSSSFA